MGETKAVIEAREGTEFAAIWYLELPGGTGNVLACVSKQPSEEWLLVYRFRYYRDDKVHGSSDDKNWYVYSGPKDKMVEVFDMLFQRMCASGFRGERIDCVGLNSDQVMEAIIAKPWAHVGAQAVDA